MKSFDDLVDAEISISKIDEPQAVTKLLGTIEGVQAYQREREARLIKAVSAKPHADAGGEPDLGDPLDDAGTLERLTREHMKAHPEVTSKSRAYEQVLRSDAGKRIMARDKKRVGIV